MPGTCPAAEAQGVVVDTFPHDGEQPEPRHFQPPDEAASPQLRARALVRRVETRSERQLLEPLVVTRVSDLGTDHDVGAVAEREQGDPGQRALERAQRPGGPLRLRHGGGHARRQ